MAIVLLSRNSCLTCLFLSLSGRFKLMTFVFAFECSNIQTFDFVNVMNSNIAMHNHLFVFRLLFTFKYVLC